LGFSKKRAGYVLAGATLVLLLGYAARSQPRLITAWTLLEKLEVSPMETPARQDWAALAQYASFTECVRMLREKVQKDEQEGSRAVFGERSGAMAVTVLVQKETVANQENSAATPHASPPDEGALSQERRILTKRVRTLECRATQRMETESWLQSTLRRWGLLQ
jgi:hypothetical protein